MNNTLRNLAPVAFQRAAVSSALVLLMFGLILPVAGTALAFDCNSFRLWSFNIRFDNGFACSSDCDNSWNRLSGEARRDLAEKYMTSYAPHIFGLQEVRDPLSGLFRKSQLADVADWFPDHQYYAVDRGDGEYAAIFWDATRFLMLNSGTFWLSCDSDQQGTLHPDATHPRIVSWVLLYDLKTWLTFYVFNTHFPLTTEDDARNYSSALLRQRAHSIAVGLPVIIIGDLNSTENSTALKILRGELTASAYLNNSCTKPSDVAAASLPLLDSFSQAGGSDGKTFHGFSGGSSGGSRIDHVLQTTDAFLPYQAAIRRDSYDSGACDLASCFPSDHYAVEVSFRIPLSHVWVDFERNAASVCEAGTASEAFATLEAAVKIVRPGGTLHVRTGSTGTKAIVLDRPMTIVAEGGRVAIGGSLN